MPETILSVTLENRPGTVADVGEALGREHVSIQSIAGLEAGDQGKLVLLTDNPEKAFEVLRTEGYEVETRTGLMLMVSDDPGEMGRLTRQIADAGVNVTSVLTTRDGRLVLGVSDYAKAKNVVGGAAVEAR